MPSIKGCIGIGHTRWATCGKPSRANAHPFLDCSKRFAVVHNGIIENHIPIREKLKEEGHIFTSRTDTEVIVHLVEKYYDGDLHKALVRALKDIKGTYAVAVVESDADKIVAARKENPLVVGLGVGENLIASDITALLNYTNKVMYVMDGESVVVTPNKVELFDNKGEIITRAPNQVTWTIDDAQKGGYEHFMLKEIFEQPSAIHNSLLGTLNEIETETFPPRCRFQRGEIGRMRNILSCRPGWKIHHRVDGKGTYLGGARIGISLFIGHG